MHKSMLMPTCRNLTVLRTEQRNIEDSKLNSQKVAENNNSKKQNQRQTRSNITQIFSIFFVENHSTTLHYTMHMAWVGLHDFIYIKFLVSSQGPLPKEDPVGACGDGVSRGMHWARGAETFAHWPRQRQRAGYVSVCPHVCI